MRDRLIDRPAAMRRVEDSFRVHPAVALVGPRQCGKTTLARMIAGNYSRALGSSQAVARRYLDILNGAYMVRVLQPWHENLKKRQVKAPKIYVRDTGLLHALLETPSSDALLGHPKVGASFEGFAIEQLLSLTDVRSANFGPRTVALNSTC